MLFFISVYKLSRLDVQYGVFPFVLLTVTRVVGVVNQHPATPFLFYNSTLVPFFVVIVHYRGALPQPLPVHINARPFSRRDEQHLLLLLLVYLEQVVRVLCVWVCGCVGVWVCGCVCVCRCLRVSLSEFLIYPASTHATDPK